MDAVNELAEGKLVADIEIGEIPSINNEIASIQLPYTSQEIERYKKIFNEATTILHNLAYEIEPGKTERDVVARMWEAYVRNGFDCSCMFATNDERINKFRHGVPSDKKIEKTILISSAIEKYGLNLTSF
jgi:Xaa-Pro aminopeptidase